MMSMSADFIAGFGVRGKLGAAHAPSPVFGGGNEGAAYSPSTHVSIDKPGFQIADLTGVASFGMGAD